MGTDCKSAAFSFGGSNPPAPTKKTSVENTLVFCFIRYLKFHPQGWIRTATATSLKTAQKQPSATATTAASGRSREELLGLRPAGCACRPRHDAAAGSRDPGSFLFCAARDIHPRPPKRQTDTQKQPSCRPKSVSAYKSPHPAAAAADRVRAFFV